MEKYDYRKSERLRGVRVKQVWLKEDLLQGNSESISVHPGLKKILTSENENLNAEDINYIRSLKNFILSAKDLFIIFLDTETKTERSVAMGGRAFLTDKKNFMDITELMMITNLAGCKFKIIEPPYEDFIYEFIVEVYF
jgi:hypothetical protein